MISDFFTKTHKLIDMATTSFDSVFTLGATTLFIPVGNTLAVFCQPQQGQMGWRLKAVGGSFEILPTGIGSSILNLNFATTLSGAALVTLTAKGYPFLIADVPFDVAGPMSFYLNCLGATGICALLLYKGQGY